jgi:hypothetical protein
MAERTDQERIAELERTVAHLLELLGPAADSVSTAYTTTLALQAILEAKGILTDEEVASKKRAIEDAATLEMEHAPEYEEFRRMREIIQRTAEPKDQT